MCFAILEARDPHFIYAVIKFLLILIKLKNLFVNENPRASITADLLVSATVDGYDSCLAFVEAEG